MSPFVVVLGFAVLACQNPPPSRTDAPATDAGLVRGAAAQDTLWLAVRTGEVTSVTPAQEQPADESA